MNDQSVECVHDGVCCELWLLLNWLSLCCETWCLVGCIIRVSARYVDDGCVCVNHCVELVAGVSDVVLVVCELIVSVEMRLVGWARLWSTTIL